MKMNQKGQTSLEMAAFGSMILIALVSLFSYGQKVNDQQYLLMSAFRHALANAHGLEGGGENEGWGGAASYSILETPRYYAGDLSHKGSRSTVSGGGSVLWGKLSINTIEKTDPVTNKPYTTIDMGGFGESSIYKINEDECPYTMPSESNTSMTTRINSLINAIQEAIEATQNGQEISESVQKALEAYEKAMDIDPTGKTLEERLNALLEACQGALEDLANGKKVEGAVKKALEAYEEAEGIKRSVGAGIESWENSKETMHKEEDSSSISTTQGVDLKDKIIVTLTEKKEESDGTATEVPILSVTQYLYRDSDGRYKYSQAAGEASRAIRSQTWITPHEEN